MSDLSATDRHIIWHALRETYLFDGWAALLDAVGQKDAHAIADLLVAHGGVDPRRSAFEESDLYDEASMAYVDERNPNQDISWGELASLQSEFDESEEYEEAYKRWLEEAS